MATGVAVLDFGAHPGKSIASVDITGQGSIVSDSRVEAWINLPATSGHAGGAYADHSADEHRIEKLKVTAGNISAGVGFTIYGEGDIRCHGHFSIQWVWA